MRLVQHKITWTSKLINQNKNHNKNGNLKQCEIGNNTQPKQRNETVQIEQQQRIWMTNHEPKLLDYLLVLEGWIKFFNIIYFEWYFFKILIYDDMVDNNLF